MPTLMLMFNGLPFHAHSDAHIQWITFPHLPTLMLTFNGLPFHAHLNTHIQWITFPHLPTLMLTFNGLPFHAHSNAHVQWITFPHLPTLMLTFNGLTFHICPLWCSCSMDYLSTFAHSNAHIQWITFPFQLWCSHSMDYIWKIWIPKKLYPTIWPVLFYHSVLCPKDAERIANSLVHDQTTPERAVWSGSSVFLLEYSKSLRYSH